MLQYLGKEPKIRVEKEVWSIILQSIKVRAGARFVMGRKISSVVKWIAAIKIYCWLWSAFCLESSLREVLQMKEEKLEGQVYTTLQRGPSVHCDVLYVKYFGKELWNLWVFEGGPFYICLAI